MALLSHSVPLQTPTYLLLPRGVPRFTTHCPLSRVKLVRFALNAQRADVVEPGKEAYKALSDRWNTDFFRTTPTTPLTLEVGCGKGDYTVGLARHFPDQNFLGFDVKGERLWTGATRAQELGLRNVGWLRGRAHELAEHFAPAELAAIWITFPDPRPKLADARRRLTAPRYLEIYQRLLRPGGTLHLKTDDAGLFAYTLAEALPMFPLHALRYTHDLYGPETDPALLANTFGIQTHYETRFRAQGKPIHYLELGFKP